MSQLTNEPLLSTQKQTVTEQTSLEYSHTKDNPSLQRLDYSTSTVNDHKHNSSHLDNLLYSSFVQLDQFVQRDYQTFNLDTGQSFFKRSNHLFFSDIGKRQQKNKMCHKKVQCQIGQGKYLATRQPSNTLINKFKTLQVLKMVKLLKLIFKQLKQSISSIKKEIALNDQNNRQKLFQLQLIFQSKISQVNQNIHLKNNKIAEFQRQIEMLNEYTNKLKQDLDHQMEENIRLLKYIEEQKQKNTFEINRLENQKQQNILQLNQKIENFEITHSVLQDEINNLNEIIIQQQRQNKKLQYQKKILQNDYTQLSKRNEEWLKKSLENQVSFNEDCINFQRNNEEISQLMRLNNLYLKEIQSCKSEIQKTKEQNLLIKRQSDNYIAEQIQNLGQYYERKYKELQSTQNSEEKQNNPNYVQVFKKKQSQCISYKNRQKRNISTLTFCNAIKSMKINSDFQDDSQVTHSMANKKQNKNTLNLGIKKLTKHLSQQIKEPLSFQNHQNTFSTISSTEYIDISEKAVFKANEHFKGKIKLSNLLYNHKEASISSQIKSIEANSNSQSYQGKKMKKNFSNFIKN